MANGHGGSRTPGSPAPVSGPGALSKRTDGQGTKYVSGLPYGEGQDFVDLQSSAPMAKAASPSPNTRQGSAAATGARLPTPLGAPTERPDEPLTEGNPMGAGAGEGVLTHRPMGAGSREVFKADAKSLAPYLPGLLRAAEATDAPQGFVRFVRYLRNIQGA